MRDDLYQGLAELAQIPDLGWVIIEPSGMADAERLARLLERFPRILDPLAAARYRLQCRLSIVDAMRYRLLMRSVPHLIRASVRVADVVLLNKVDAAKAGDIDAIEADIRKHMKPTAVLQRVSAKDGLTAPVIRDVLAMEVLHV